MRWGLPSPAWVTQKAAKERPEKLRAKGKEYDWEELLRMEPDAGITNVRKTEIAHWQQWMGAKNRCLVPMTSFSEPDQVGGSRKFQWFALDESRPLAFFAGVWTPHACVRKVKTGWEEIEVYGFMTTDARQPVLAFHDKAQPVILTSPAEWDLWLSDARAPPPAPAGISRAARSLAWCWSTKSPDRRRTSPSSPWRMRPAWQTSWSGRPSTKNIDEPC